MFRKSTVLMTTAALCFSGTVLSGEIYKWTDEKGDVHYEDRPVGEEVQRLSLASKNTDNSAVQSSIEARREVEKARADARSKASENEQSAATERAAAAERTAKCDESRARMEGYLQARRLYNQDASGERVYLDDTEIMAARERAQNEIQKYCN